MLHSGLHGHMRKQKCENKCPGRLNSPAVSTHPPYFLIPP